MVGAQFLLTVLVVVLMLGTGVLYTLGLGCGCRTTIAAAAGCTLGVVPRLTAATLVLAAIVPTSALAFQVVEAAGVAYLLWLASQSLSTDGLLAPQGAQSAGGLARAASIPPAWRPRQPR